MHALLSERRILRGSRQLRAAGRGRGVAAAALLHRPRLLRIREGSAVQSRMAVRRPRIVGGETGRLLHHPHHRRAAGRLPGHGGHAARDVGGLPAPRHAGGRRPGQRARLRLPLPSLGLLARRLPAQRPGDGPHLQLRQVQHPPAGVQGRGLAGLHLRQLRSDRQAPGAAAAGGAGRDRALRPGDSGGSRPATDRRSSPGTGR